MSEKYFPELLFELGYTDLVSVIPPGAQLTPTSKIATSSIGKVPGRKLPNGLYAGYDWRKVRPSLEDVRRWLVDGASVGLLANRFPGVDIDCTDAGLAQIIEDAAIAKLGIAPKRTGRAPKRLLMYRTSEPFSRMRLYIKKGNDQHLVEILGEGQQYLVHGIHPATGKPYEWDGSIPHSESLCSITREMAEEFLTYLASVLDMLSVGTVTREGDGRRRQRNAAGDQAGLVAPSMDLLHEAVALIPNNNDLFPDREDYIRMGYAIRAASGDEIEDGYPIFAEWAGKHESDGRVAGNPETWQQDWVRMKPPFALGWSWIAEQARAFGFSDADLDFEAFADAPRPTESVIEAPIYSDQWLADKVVAARNGELRYVPQKGVWVVWNSGRWQPDAELLAEDIVKQELRIIASKLMKQGGAVKEQKEAQQTATQICSAGKAAAVRGLMQSDRTIAVSMDALDHNPWLLNTPSGIVDLKTGELNPSDPDALCTKSTAVPAAFGVECPEWRRFLGEATGGDKELELYLQRLSGYCLTGSTQEQNLTFIWGSGENGKSVFLNAIAGIAADYAKVASMETFTASHSDKHTTDIAMLTGARLVTASETQAGKRWDEAKIKGLTGGEPITARFMRQDNFTYLPQFKLVFIGNHRPEIRDVDRAMRRRIQMVPFDIKPKIIDKELAAKLRLEWPAILAWMIEGCLEWQKIGLALPASVRGETEKYFEGEDAVGRWLAECTEAEPTAITLVADLFASWREWSNGTAEYTGSLKRLSAALMARKFERTQEPVTRKKGFKGIKIIDRQQFGIV